MEDLERIINENKLTIENVRDLVDDYSLISYYLGQELELNTRYSSPLREGDESPSFSIFYGYDSNKNQDKLYFKDQAGFGKGGVIDFLKLYLNAPSTQSVLEQINYDLKLGLDFDEKCNGLKPTLVKKIPVLKERPTIKIVSKLPSKEFIEYWAKKYDITLEMLKFYNVKCVDTIQWKTTFKTTVQHPHTLCIAYTIGMYYKLYCPYAPKEDKFRNNYPSNYVEGYLQIDWSRNDLLVITKSTKECILFRQHWNIQAIAGKSETTIIQPEIMLKCLNHFKRIVVWLDPDRTGIESTEKYISLYPSLIPAELPKGITEKDPTDIYEVRRFKETDLLIKKVLSL